MSNTPVTPTPDQMQPPAGPPTGTPPAQAPSGVGSAITGQPAGQPPTAQPNAAPNPVAAPAGQPQGQPNQPNAAQPAPDPHEVQGGMFTKILRGLTPPTTYIDPTGQVQVMKQNAPSMGATIMSAVLAGMFAKNNYREGAYGPVLDRQATAADAFNAGQGVVAKQNAAAQKLSDDQQAKKLSYAAANLASMQNYAALEHTRFAAEKEGTEAEKTQSEFLQKQADQNNLTLGASADAYDQALTDKDAPKARLAQKATMDELLSGPFKSKMMQQLMVQDGVRSVYSEATGRTHTVPTYSLYNPDVELKLNKDAVDRAAKINPSFQGIYEVAGGNVPLNLGRYATLTHQINSVDHAEDTLQSLSDSQDALAKKLGISGNVEGRLAAVVKGNPSAMKSLLEFENATAHGGNSADQLQRLLQSDGGDAIFKALGTDRDKVTDYIEAYNNRLVSGRKLAAEGGIGDKAPAPQQMTDGIIASAKNLPKDQRDAIMAGVNPNGLTVGEAEKLKDKVLQAVQQNRTDAANNPKLGTAAPPANFVSNPNASTMDSVDLQKDLTTRGVKLPVQFESLYTVAHNAAGLKDVFPTSPRKGTTGLSAQEALAFIHQYINPTYQEGDYPAAASLSKELASTKVGVAGGSLLNAGVASNHLELLDQAATALSNNDIQAINRLANSFGIAVGKSPAVTFKAIADQVNGEVGKVVVGGAPHEAELENLRANLNTDQSPEQTRNVIKSYVKLMSGRINEINERSQQYFQRDVKGISPETAKVFAKYGVEVPGYAIVTIPGVAKATLVPKSQLAAIKAKYPNATTGGQ